MTSQIIFGTLLPLLDDPEAGKLISSAKGALIITGVCLSCLGFGMMGRAGWMRDHPSRNRCFPRANDGFPHRTRAFRHS
jgi:hypothetical protein